MTVSNPTIGPLGIDSDPEYASAQSALQQGRWAEAIQLLSALTQRYPDNRTLQAQLNDARTKSTFDVHTPQVRTERHLPRWVLLVMVVAFVAAAAYGAYYIYIHEIQPNQQRVVTIKQITDLVNAGQTALAHQDLEVAQKNFEQAQTLLPAGEAENPAIKAGLREVEKQRALATRYDEATKLLAAGKQAEGVAALEALEADSPNYRDAAAQIKLIKDKVDAEKAFAEAESAYGGQRWQEAAIGYEMVRKLDSNYHKQEIAAHAYDAYLNQGMQLIVERPTDPKTVDQALTWFSKALSIKPGDSKATAERKRIQGYLTGRDALNSGDMERAIPALRTVYETHPQFLGGLLVEQLYNAYLERGSQLEAKGDFTSAYIQYQVASRLEGVDTKEAKYRSELIAPRITPTATPTATPLPSATPRPTASPVPPARPTEIPLLDITTMHNVIVFRSDRPGAIGLFVMDPSGKVLGATKDLPTYKDAYERGKYSPDGKASVYNSKNQQWETEKNGRNPTSHIWLYRHDLPKSWVRNFSLIDSGFEDYDPVWSPKGDLVAFVSPRTGNDEIFTIPPYTNGEVTKDQVGLKQLTSNQWEWDKHPFFSPDGSKIVFFSNRLVGRRQIWIMNVDGSDQRPMSPSEFEDWDPVWIP